MQEEEKEEEYKRRRREAARTCRGRRRVTIFMISLYIALGIYFGRRNGKNNQATLTQATTMTQHYNATNTTLNETSSDNDEKDTGINGQLLY